MNSAMETFTGFTVAVLGLAMVAVLVSKNAQTASLITNIGNALVSIIGAAVSPVTGAGTAAGSVANLGNTASNLFSSSTGG